MIEQPLGVFRSAVRIEGKDMNAATHAYRRWAANILPIVRALASAVESKGIER